MRLSRVASLIALGAALVAAAALLTWAGAEITDDLRGVLTESATGSAVSPALVPLAAAALAALGAVLATRGRGRRLVGALVSVIGLAAGALGVRGLTHQPLEAFAAKSSGAGAVVIGIHPIGPIAAILGGLCLLLAGLPIVSGRLAGRALGPRYERRPATRTAAESAASSTDPALAMWKELDQHRDPTLGDDGGAEDERLSQPPGTDSNVGKPVL